MNTKIELLAPAKNLENGRIAIDCGADAVYIGAARYGARQRAGNSLEDLQALVEYAHQYWASVYITVNTLLHDDELPAAVDLIHQLHAINADAVIIQDMGLLECDLPPIPIIASTQMHNHSPERVAFLQDIGIQRVILARELSLEQIRAIREYTQERATGSTPIELEAFVHGALCVSYSGQCYMSYAVGGRSGNRGECAQPCRRIYSLVDGHGKIIVGNKHLLSLRDMNLSHSIGDMLDAGIVSFKIEGRLKDDTYIKNVVTHYRQELDTAMASRGLVRSSSGISRTALIPDVDATFNRDYTPYFIKGRQQSPGRTSTPKMVGKPLGVVKNMHNRLAFLETEADLIAGDGITWFDDQAVLQGTVINNAIRTEHAGEWRITLNDKKNLHPGITIYRNHDHAALREIAKSEVERQIHIAFIFKANSGGYSLVATDEDGVSTHINTDTALEPANNAENAINTLDKQLRKLGNTPFECTDVDIQWDRPYFLRVADINTLRRDIVQQLEQVRAEKRPRRDKQWVRNEAPYPEAVLDYRGNVLNQKALAFYERHGVTVQEMAAESGLNMEGRIVMTTRYCLQHELGLCDGSRSPGRIKGPLYLVDEDGHRYPVSFNCNDCEMIIRY